MKSCARPAPILPRQWDGLLLTPPRVPAVGLRFEDQKAKGEVPMKITRVGVDIAKNTFYVHGVDRHEQPQWRGQYKRGRWLDALCKRVPAGSEIGMEACG